LLDLQLHLRMLGDANDAEDHGFLKDAEQERESACFAILELLDQHTFLSDLLPTLREQLASLHILTFGWAEIYDRIGAVIRD